MFKTAQENDFLPTIVSVIAILWRLLNDITIVILDKNVVFHSKPGYRTVTNTAQFNILYHIPHYTRSLAGD